MYLFAAVSRFIHDRFTTCFKEVILNPRGPFGAVDHYFWRVEYQVILFCLLMCIFVYKQNSFQGRGVQHYQ